jgi:predicted NBD/HSP70 family sugar kinase
MGAVLVANVGGTTTRVAVVFEGRILRQVKFPTADYDTTIERVHLEAAKLRRHCRYEIVGFGLCAAANVEDGVIIKAPNLDESWVNRNICSHLATLLGLLVVQLNDAQAEGLGEFSYFGVPLAYVGLGTGVGVSEITINAKGLPESKATERGHDVIDLHSTLKCGCGRLGDAEAKFGMSNLPARYNVAHVSELTDAQWSEVLGEVAAFIRNLSNRKERLVVIGGGGGTKQLGPNGANRLPELVKLVEQIPSTTAPPEVALAYYDEDSALFGLAVAVEAALAA